MRRKPKNYPNNLPTMRIGIGTYALTMILGGLPALSWGQADSTFKDATIDIIQSYEPQVREAEKPRWSPSPPPLDTHRATLQFDVPQQALSYTYAALPIRPLSLSRDSLPPSYPDYLLVGLGNRSSRTLAATLSRLSTPRLGTRIQFHHHGLKGSQPHQHSSRTDILARLQSRKSRQPWTADLGFHHQRYGLYGYDARQYEFPRDSALAAYTGLKARLGTENLLGKGRAWSDAPQLDLSLFRTRTGRTETQVQLSVPIQYRLLPSLNFSAEAFASLAQYDGQGNSLAAIRPGLHWHRGPLQARAGLHPTWGEKGGYLLPDLSFTYRPRRFPLGIDLGYRAEISQNLFEEWVHYNPYVTDRYTPVQSHLRTVHAGLELHAGHHLQAGVRGSWTQYDYFAFLASSGPQGRYFSFHPFEELRSRSISIYGRYQIGHLLSIGLVQEWISFSQIEGHQPWHIPTWRTRADLSAQPWKRLRLGAYLLYLGGIHASDLEKLDPGLDLGLNGEYALGQRLSAWARVDNLFNSQYQRWSGYPQFGIRGMAGIRFRF